MRTGSVLPIKLAISFSTFFLLAGWTTAQSSDPSAQLDQAISLYEKGKTKEAISLLQTIVAADAADGKAYYYLGMSLLQAGQPQGAETALQKAQALNVDKEKINYGLARAYVEMNQVAKAEQLMPQQPAAGEQFDYYFSKGLISAKKGNFQEAATNLDKAIQAKPDRPYPYYYNGMAYGKLKRADKMVENFQIFLKLAPDAPEAPKVKALLRSIG